MRCTISCKKLEFLIYIFLNIDIQKSQSLFMSWIVSNTHNKIIRSSNRPDETGFFFLTAWLGLFMLATVTRW